MSGVAAVVLTGLVVGVPWLMLRLRGVAVPPPGSVGPRATAVPPRRPSAADMARVAKELGFWERNDGGWAGRVVGCSLALHDRDGTAELVIKVPDGPGFRIEPNAHFRKKAVTGTDGIDRYLDVFAGMPIEVHAALARPGVGERVRRATLEHWRYDEQTWTWIGPWSKVAERVKEGADVAAPFVGVARDPVARLVALARESQSAIFRTFVAIQVLRDQGEAALRAAARELGIAYDDREAWLVSCLALDHEGIVAAAIAELDHVGTLRAVPALRAVRPPLDGEAQAVANRIAAKSPGREGGLALSDDGGRLAITAHAENGSEPRTVGASEP